MPARKKRQNEFMESILRQWYGKDQSEAEMLRYTPETRPISDPLDKVMKKLVPPWEFKISQIRMNWTAIAGMENARRCRPAFLNNGIFYIEVSHPAYRIALETPAIKNQLLERIQEIIGKELCQGIKFIAGGRTLPRK